jgi:hypothetical protein
MGKASTPGQRRENARFIELPGETAIARLAARGIGWTPSTMNHRRGPESGEAGAGSGAAGAPLDFARDERGGGGRKKVLRQPQDERGFGGSGRAGWGSGSARVRNGRLDEARRERSARSFDRSTGLKTGLARHDRGAGAADERCLGGARREGGGGGSALRTKGGEAVVVRSPLHLLTGWSKASGKAHHPGVAFFGGWRIGDMRRKIG